MQYENAIKPDLAALVPTVDPNPNNWSHETDECLEDFFCENFCFLDNSKIKLNRETIRLIKNRLQEALDDHPELYSGLPDFNQSVFISKFIKIIKGYRTSLRSALFAKRILDRMANDEKLRKKLMIKGYLTFNSSPFSIDGMIYPSFYSVNMDLVEELTNDMLRCSVDSSKSKFKKKIFQHNGTNHYRNLTRGAKPAMRGDKRITRPFRFSKYMSHKIYDNLSDYADIYDLDMPEREDLFLESVRRFVQ